MKGSLTLLVLILSANLPALADAASDAARDEMKAQKEYARAVKKAVHAQAHHDLGPTHNWRSFGNVLSSRASTRRAIKASRKAAKEEWEAAGQGAN